MVGEMTVSLPLVLTQFLKGSGAAKKQHRIFKSGKLLPLNLHSKDQRQ